MLCHRESDAAGEVVVRIRAPRRYLPVLDEDLPYVVGAPDVPGANDRNCRPEALWQRPERCSGRDVVHRDGNKGTDTLVVAVGVAALRDEVDGVASGYGMLCRVDATFPAAW